MIFIAEGQHADLIDALALKGLRCGVSSRIQIAVGVHRVQVPNKAGELTNAWELQPRSIFAGIGPSKFHNKLLLWFVGSNSREGEFFVQRVLDIGLESEPEICADFSELEIAICASKAILYFEAEVLISADGLRVEIYAKMGGGFRCIAMPHQISVSEEGDLHEIICGFRNATLGEKPSIREWLLGSRTPKRISWSDSRHKARGNRVSAAMCCA